MIEMRAIFYGRVQGVGFRATAQIFARELLLSGFVKNCADGSVEVVAQGDRGKCEELLGQLKDEFHVENIDVHFVKPTKPYTHFSALT